MGPYDLVRVIGSGGMGVVYEARHRSLGRRVAIKVMHARLEPGASRDLATARFLREGRAAAQVRHPNVVDVFDLGVHDGVPYLAMELVEGETLAQLLAREGALAPTRVAELMLPILAAVGELHAAGVVHRDLKPANILLSRERGGVCPKVADFGLSRLDDGSAPLTASNVVVGTYAYMSPEQARVSKEATEHSDQYALGVVLYECVTGVRPFQGSAPYELLHAIVHDSPAPPSKRRADVPAAFDAMVMRAMARSPDDRFASVDELGEALLAFATPAVAARWVGELTAPRSQSDSTVMPMSSLPARGPASTVRRAGWWPAVAGVATVAAALGGFAARGGSRAAATATAPVASATSVVTATPIAPAPAPAPSIAPVPTSIASALADPPAPKPATVARPRAVPRPAAAPTSAPLARAAAAEDNGAPILDP
jgi:serine/threonine-protein kinase